MSILSVVKMEYIKIVFINHIIYTGTIVVYSVVFFVTYFYKVFVCHSRIPIQTNASTLCTVFLTIIIIKQMRVN